ncbi:deoxyribodipyrimidine photolyase [Maricaulis sp. W15]|uniref:cryptochrome/photolyase family protein n=1 Tax=Maricaulis sp. W15 TaxID=1772333 RepID=UPI000948D384|nr:deoxyribodipyrimidine photo-lyase [Maricaulis sp. W15]OLF78004.1 deoxyribodipyrimidine photolyase [Maricaulis sp. W15]
MASSSATDTALVWFRRDLRLADNPALHAAVQSGRPLVCVYVHETGSDTALAPGSASAWWLHHSLTRLGDAIESIGGQLVLRQGPASQVLPALCQEAGCSEVFWNRSDIPQIDARDCRLASELAGMGVRARGFRASTLIDPQRHLNGSGAPYRVFTPFWKAALKELDPREALPAPIRLVGGPRLVSDRLDTWHLRPTSPDWATGFDADWTPGEDGANARLDSFLANRLIDYREHRDRPDIEGTSRLSPHLAWGEISPRTVWHRARGHAERSGQYQEAEKLLAEIGWRDFATYLAAHFGDFRTANFNRQFDYFPWRENPDGLAAWKRGQTGIPMVDAAMRQLWTTGWMHNRTRMITASFLIKHLGVHWRKGMAWFEDTLVDADLNVNAASWQWVAGSGADAAPYFRVFNPVTQGEKFDPDGDYVRRWVPELANLGGKATHAPWHQSTDMLAKAGVTLGKTYPEPIIDLKLGREQALEAYQSMKADAEAATALGIDG